MIRSPRAVGADARNDLYGMLPASVRGQLRARLRGVGQAVARDAGLAAEWRAALARIAEWLGPVAHDTIRWQGELSFERRSAAAPRANVLLQTPLLRRQGEGRGRRHGAAGGAQLPVAVREGDERPGVCRRSRSTPTVNDGMLHVYLV
ncbi:avr9 Cf-9 rapidly elicited protein [Musa troglodytarum]|uniref:Avr9 Cf-9 rapidly elicited protein n=1 Tax=Musa troglodytarum TaxID=320322 RepID=A0A9E7JF80_9LILI|nr:avr9 Cf-9 rapidly elicited protein [Musa troglodytarum]